MAMLKCARTAKKEPKAMQGLQYVSDTMPGIRRRKKGSSFVYLRPNGTTIKDARTLKRIKDIVIPPAWKQVWICPQPNGHIQATGIDARGRKQYKYHADWTDHKNQTKFHRMSQFGKRLPRIRKKVQKDIRRKNLSKEKVVACIVRLLDRTHIRIGNEEYAKQNKSYGLTTLRKKHTKLHGKHIEFEFRGKSGKHHHIEVDDAEVAKTIAACEDLPGYELFKYKDEEENVHVVHSEDVNAYLKKAANDADISAKDFRTWGGTVHAALCLFEEGECTSELACKKIETATVKQVAGFLGNTPTTCKKYYIDPAIFTYYRKRVLCACLASELKRSKGNRNMYRLQPIEKAVLNILKKQKSN